MSEEKKGITVKIDADLHAEVKAFIESQGLTMGEFVAKALDDELHPRITIAGGNTMEKMRTMAFQIPEDLFQKIKDYLNRNHMTQKEFVLGLITKEIDRDLAAHQEATESIVSEEEEDELYDDLDEDIDDDEDEDCDEDDDEDYDDEEDEDAEYDEDEEEDCDEAEDESDEYEEDDEAENYAEAEEPVM